MPVATEWATVKIKLPREMVHVDDKTGRVSLLANPLTKQGNLAKKGGEWSIQLETDPHIDKPEIVDEGQLINTYDAKEKGKRYKGQINETKDRKTDMLGELKRDAGRVRTRAIVPVNSERAIVPVGERAIVPVGERAIVPVGERAIVPMGERAIVPIFDERVTVPVGREQKKRRPRLQPIDVDDGGLDGFADVLDRAPARGTRRPIDEAINGAISRLDADLRVANRRYTAFEELRGVGQAALSRIQQDSGVEEHKSPESHEMLRQRQEGRRAVAFEQLRGIGKKAIKKQANAENYAANRDRIRQHRNEQVTCDCGDTVMRTNMARHLKSKRHLDRMG
jgi:hypothetical protein